jgi:hypothetical protein
MKKILVIILLAAVLSLFLFAILSLIVKSQADARACCGVFPAVSWKVERTGPDSVVMTLRSIDRRIGTEAGERPAVRIFANGNEVSNMSVIRDGGLTDNVSPPGGLQFREGGSVTLSGEDLRMDAKKPLRIQVMIGRIVSEPFSAGEWYMVYDTCPDTGGRQPCYSVS